MKIILKPRWYLFRGEKITMPDVNECRLSLQIGVLVTCRHRSLFRKHLSTILHTISAFMCGQTY
jgi:hypothetical protein